MTNEPPGSSCLYYQAGIADACHLACSCLFVKCEYLGPDLKSSCLCSTFPSEPFPQIPFSQVLVIGAKELIFSVLTKLISSGFFFCGVRLSKYLTQLKKTRFFFPSESISCQCYLLKIYRLGGKNTGQTSQLGMTRQSVIRSRNSVRMWGSGKRLHL